MTPPAPAPVTEPVADGGAALAVEGVSHSFGAKRALENVAFTVPPGEFAVLLGLTGARQPTLV
ncbi:MAG: ABC transporter ATP-binding protein, partial [Proteobacteria bacterium]|nr:ABC transporter ATP-binding protein [Pseudomonadota bacterium]